LVDSFWGFPLQLPCSGLLFWFLISFIEKNRKIVLEKTQSDLQNT